MARFESKAGSANTEYETCPAGNHAARVVAVVIFGTFNEKYEDKAKGTSKDYEAIKVGIYWEIVAKRARMKDGRRFIFGEEYNWAEKLSPNAKLRKMMASVTGQKYNDDATIDPRDLVKYPALLNIIHSKSGDNTYSNLASNGITPCPEEMVDSLDSVSREPVFFDVEDSKTPPDLSWLPAMYGPKPSDYFKFCKEYGGDGTHPKEMKNKASSKAPAVKEPDDGLFKTINDMAEAVRHEPEGSAQRDACDNAIADMMRPYGLEVADPRFSEAVREVCTPF